LVVERALNKLGYSIEMAELQYIPNNEQKLSLEDMEMCQKLIDAFDEDDDVDEVFNNAVEE
jgi:transcriptional/translational regulatory protein YebC/TACO1